MTRLRAEKVEKIADVLPPLEIEGCQDADLLIVGFGGTYGHLHSAMDALNKQGKESGTGSFPFYQSATAEYRRSVAPL